MTFITFLFTAALLAITPGPGLAYVVARTAAGGRSEGLASCLGTGIGGMFHVAAAALGLSVLIAQSAFAFSVLKYLGAAYLVYLGIRMLLRSTPDATDSPVVSSGGRRAFLEGILVEAFNVKTALFFLAFLPQFIDSTSSVAFQLVSLGTICILLNTFVDVCAVIAAERILQSKGSRSGRTRLLNSVSGTTMVGLGAFLALARRQQ